MLFEKNPLYQFQWESTKCRDCAPTQNFASAMLNSRQHTVRFQSLAYKPPYPDDYEMMMKINYELVINEMKDENEYENE